MSLTRSCMSDRIKKELMHRICEGIYQPGDRLIELQIAREFETSQAPVREALCELQIMGIVETEPYKGTHVKEISSEELEESIKIRAALESLAAESVDERMLHKIETLRKKAVETVKYARQRDGSKFVMANIEFHRMIVQASNNKTLIATWENLAPELRMKACVKLNVDKLEAAAHEHLDIVEAFAEGDNRFAAKLLKKHAETIITRLHEKSVNVKEAIV